MRSGTAGQRVGVALLAAVGLFGAAWAAQPGPDGPSSNAKALAEDDARGRSNPSAWVDKLRGELDQCSCGNKQSLLGNDSLIALPGCLVKKLFDPCAHDGVGLVGLVTLAVFFAVLTRQTTLGYRRNWRLSFALFLVLFLGTTIFDAFVFPSSGTNLLTAEFMIILLASAFFGGVLAFWARYLLDLLAVAAGVFLVALPTHFILPHGMPMVMVAAGMAGGVWLHWWRDHREKPRDPASGSSGQAPRTGP